MSTQKTTESTDGFIPEEKVKYRQKLVQNKRNSQAIYDKLVKKIQNQTGDKILKLNVISECGTHETVNLFVGKNFGKLRKMDSKDDKIYKENVHSLDESVKRGIITPKQKEILETKVLEFKKQEPELYKNKNNLIEILRLQKDKSGKINFVDNTKYVKCRDDLKILLKAKHLELKRKKGDEGLKLAKEIESASNSLVTKSTGIVCHFNQKFSMANYYKFGGNPPKITEKAFKSGSRIARERTKQRYQMHTGNLTHNKQLLEMLTGVKQFDPLAATKSYQRFKEQENDEKSTKPDGVLTLAIGAGSKASTSVVSGYTLAIVGGVVVLVAVIYGYFYYSYKYNIERVIKEEETKCSRGEHMSRNALEELEGIRSRHIFYHNPGLANRFFYIKGFAELKGEDLQNPARAIECWLKSLDYQHQDKTLLNISLLCHKMGRYDVANRFLMQVCPTSPYYSLETNTLHDTLEAQNIQIPDQYICPIWLNLMRDPVKVFYMSNGQERYDNFSRESIKDFIKKNYSLNPNNRQPIIRIEDDPDFEIEIDNFLRKKLKIYPVQAYKKQSSSCTIQ